jgi:hypothetical protein
MQGNRKGSMSVLTPESMKMARQFMLAWWGPTVTDGLAEPLAALLDRARLNEAEAWFANRYGYAPDVRLKQLSESAALFQCEAKS